MATADINASKVIVACTAATAAAQGTKVQYDPSFSLLKQLHDLAQAVVTSGGTTINLAMADFQMIAPYFS